MPIGDDVSLSDLELDPDPILARMRAREPVCWVPALDMWLVTRWDDVEAIDADPATFTAATDPSFLARALGTNMLTLDPPACTRLQDATRPSFQPRGAAGTFVGERLEALADSFIDAIGASAEGAEGDRRCDLMADYAALLAAGSLADVLGFGADAAHTMWRWCRGVCADIANFDDDPGKAALGAAARDELGVAIRSRLDELRASADACALADFLAATPDGGPLTTDEIVNNVRLMISGGINEPRDGVGLVVWMLLTRPDLRQRIDESPERWPKLVEEVFRRFSPVGTITRQATRDVTFRGVEIGRGQLVSGVLRSANLDERRFADPLEIDLDRRERGHAAFATGPHRCLGEWLGRQEVRIGAKRVLDRLDGLELDGPVDVRGFEFRGPTTLPVRFRSVVR
jgi:cytochrome P450